MTNRAHEICLVPNVDSIQCEDTEPVELARRTGQFVAIDVDRHSFCGLRTDGYLVCWNTARNFRTVLPPSPMGPKTGLQVESSGACGLRADGAIACAPLIPKGLPSGPFVSFVAQAGFCGLKSDGMVVCQGGIFNHGWPIPPGPFTSLTAGGGGSGEGLFCGLNRAGTLECWGHVSEHLRDGLPEGPFSSVSIGDHICGVKTEGSLECRGHRYGDNEIPAGSFSMVSVGTRHACGIRNGGEVECWGDDSYGQAYSPPGQFASVSAGFRFSCGLKTDGQVLCWGETSPR